MTGPDPTQIAPYYDKARHKIPAIAVGTITGDQVHLAALGTIGDEPAPETLCWEIGSITKVFTGILLAEMSLRGEVGSDDPIGAHAPAEVSARLPAPEDQPTLGDLASHTAGLPRIPRGWLLRFRGSDDPYSQLTEDDVWAQLGPGTRRPSKRKSRYSNYGMGLLGHLLARATGTPYETLITERILDPLGMQRTDPFGATPPVPGFRGGRPTPPWTFGALQGAGAIRSTIDDMLTFARAVISPPDGLLGEAMGLARQPVHRGRFGVGGVGLGWHLRPAPPGGAPGIVWHNGGTYGASSFLAVDPDRGRAVIAFGNAGPRLHPRLDGPSWKLFDSLG